MGTRLVRGPARCGIFAFLALLLAAAPATTPAAVPAGSPAAAPPTAPAAALTNDDCLQCHGDKTLTGPGLGGKEISLFVNADSLKASVHDGLSCTDCHADIKEVPHGENPAKVSCGTCHSNEQAQYAASLHGTQAAAGNPDAPRCADCHGTHHILAASDSLSRVAKPRLIYTCGACHANPAVVQKLPFGTTNPVQEYLKSVHGQALLVQHNPKAPSCGTCHPAHNVLPPTDPKSAIHRQNVPHVCAECHSDIYAVYAASVHGTAVAAGNADAPTCTDCHGEHQIESPKNPNSPVFPANIARTTCMRCHASQILSQRYGFQASRVSSYLETYHGLASQRGDLAVANCASCHGVHDIYPSSDPRSTVNRANLPKTCGKCHPDAGAQFASISVHPRIGGTPSGPRPPAETVRWIYVLLLVVVIGGMAIHNGLIWWYYVTEKRRRERTLAKVRRFTRLEAIEHQLNLIAFFVLVFTGFALKYPQASWVRLTEKLGMSEGIRSLTHRVMAVLMITVAVVHGCYLLFTKRGRRDLVSLMPRAADVRDFLHTMAFHLRLRRDRPLYPRFDYTEKAEYLALIWGTSVMVASGLIMWFPAVATRHLPSWAFAVAQVVHFYEAWLAFLAILVWHFFFVLLHPDVYPMNMTWLDGKTTVEHALHRHGKAEDE